MSISLNEELNAYCELYLTELGGKESKGITKLSYLNCSFFFNVCMQVSSALVTQNTDGTALVWGESEKLTLEALPRCELRPNA